MFKTILRAAALLLLLALVSCKQANDQTVSDSASPGKLTATDALDFVITAETQLAVLLLENERMAWVYGNFITQDTEMLAALANKKFTAKQVELAIEAARYYEIPELDSDTRRKLNSQRSEPNWVACTARASIAIQTAGASTLGI